MTWTAMALLGVYHGLNPGMGWLFAVALGMQQGSARAVWAALPPIALGHALSVGVVLAVAGLAQLVVPLPALRVTVAASLIALGAYRLWRHRHPRFGGMRVGFRDLAAWSFLMASAHGAGFMLLPFVLPVPAGIAGAGPTGHVVHAHGHAAHTAAATATAPLVGALALGIHTAAYLLVMGVVAWVVYRKVGLALLRTAWINMDWLWAGALVVTGVVVLLA